MIPTVPGTSELIALDHALQRERGLNMVFDLASGAELNIPTIFRSDSMLALHQAAGFMGSHACDTSFKTLRGCYRILETAMPHDCVRLDHVYGHTGDPFNEFCDVIAKREGQQSFYLPRPHLDIPLWRPLIPHLWLLFAGHLGVPTFMGTGFDVHPPQLPPPEGPAPPCVPITAKQIDFNLSIATANVLSIGRGETGFAGKLQYLRTQFRNFHLNLVGIQKSRSDEGCPTVQGVLRLCSGAHQGQGGNEPLFVCIDANAGPGEPDGTFVLRPGFRTSSGTPLLRNFMQTLDLFSHITSDKHTGSTSTWVSPNQEVYTIDYVLVPQDWRSRCTTSTIVEDFDLGNAVMDHSAVATELQWTEVRQLPSTGSNTGDPFERSAIQARLAHQLPLGPVDSWDTDVETHLQGLNDYFHSQLRTHCRRRTGDAAKPYIDQDLWDLRKAKLGHRREFRLCQRLLHPETLSRVFAAWRQPQSEHSGPSFNFGTTLRVGAIKHWVGYLQTSRQLRHGLVWGKQKNPTAGPG
eukprot:s717_g15.t1